MGPRSRGFALQHLNVGIEPECPDRYSQREEPGRNDERCLPENEFNQSAEQDRRQGAADIAGHVLRTLRQSKRSRIDAQQNPADEAGDGG